MDASDRFEYAESDTAVSRAAGKLKPAFSEWHWNVSGEVIIDVGSSTGGFTQVLLEQGAQKVFAVDVGRGQLAWSLRNDSRVVSMEQTDIRDLTMLPEQPTAAVIDVSFTSLRNVLPAVAHLLPPAGMVAALFKPQFEVGKAIADRFRGVITDSAVVDKELQKFQSWLSAQDWTMRQKTASPIRGAKGNQEYLLWLVTPAAR